MHDVGRTSLRLSNNLRELIRSGKARKGEYLPTVRALSRSHGVAFETVQRALRALESEGLIVSEPRQGYRVKATLEADQSIAVAYVNADSTVDSRGWDSFHHGMLSVFQSCAAQRGWAVLGVSSGDRPQTAVLDQLRSARVGGVVLDTVNLELLELVKKAGLVTVMVDAWVEGAEFDSVLQDNYLGGFLAAKHLIERSHRHIGWVGPIGATAHSRERFGGAVAALAASGLEIPRELRVDTSMETLKSDVSRFLDQAKSPCGCLALWRLVAIEIARQARQRGMVLGRDIEIVGWSTEELFHENYAPHFGDGPVPATLVWSMKDAANAALERIDERRRKAELPLLRCKVPVRLKLSSNNL